MSDLTPGELAELLAAIEPDVQRREELFQILRSPAVAYIRELRRQVPLLPMIHQEIELKQAGTNWKGLCPFHEESVPSFVVNPTKNIFHCFGCSVGGDIFGWLMQRHGLSFSDALDRVRGMVLTA